MSDNPKQKIVFLDIDGVLCTPRASTAVGDRGILTYLDPIGLGLLTRLVEKFDATLVISSTWRLGRKFGDFRELFAVTGFYRLSSALPFERDAPEQIKWRTPTLPGKKRGDEIKAWIDKYQNVDTYVILDDDADMLEEQQEHFVRCTNAYDGILYLQYRQCEHVLSGKKLSEFQF